MSLPQTGTDRPSVWVDRSFFRQATRLISYVRPKLPFHLRYRETGVSSEVEEPVEQTRTAILGPRLDPAVSPHIYCFAFCRRIKEARTPAQKHEKGYHFG
jgi:hypothetical protein